MERSMTAAYQELRVNGHWDEAAISCFGKYLGENADSGKSSRTRLDTITEAHLIGSALYAEMFRESKLTAREKATLPIRQMNGHIDRAGMLQLDADSAFHFGPTLAPHDPFWALYADTVRKAFPKGLSASEPEAEAMKLVHQFRMYIDRHNIEYIRGRYKKGDPFVTAGSQTAHILTDLDSMMAYGQDLKAAGYPGLYFDEPSRYHNKTFGPESFTRQINDKILTSDRHSEFIVNRITGEFVTQWDVLEEVDGTVRVPADMTIEQQRALLNTESFNFAPGMGHQRYDVEPARPNPLYSLDYKIKQQLKNGGQWHNPSRSAYHETIGADSYVHLHTSGSKMQNRLAKVSEASPAPRIAKMLGKTRLASNFDRARLSTKQKVYDGRRALKKQAEKTMDTAFAYKTETGVILIGTAAGISLLALAKHMYSSKKAKREKEAELADMGGEE